MKSGILVLSKLVIFYDTFRGKSQIIPIKLLYLHSLFLHSKGNKNVSENNITRKKKNRRF